MIGLPKDKKIENERSLHPEKMKKQKKFTNHYSLIHKIVKDDRKKNTNLVKKRQQKNKSKKENDRKKKRQAFYKEEIPELPKEITERLMKER